MAVSELICCYREQLQKRNRPSSSSSSSSSSWLKPKFLRIKSIFDLSRSAFSTASSVSLSQFVSRFALLLSLSPSSPSPSFTKRVCSSVVMVEISADHRDFFGFKTFQSVLVFQIPYQSSVVSSFLNSFSISPTYFADLISIFPHPFNSCSEFYICLLRITD